MSDLNSQFKIMRNIIYGIKNIIRWLPIIWKDRNWDWTYFAKIMEFKLRQMSAYEIKYGHHVTSEKDAKDMLICAEILRRLIDDECQGKDYQTHLKNMYDLNRLYGKMIGSKLMSWWD